MGKISIHAPRAGSDVFPKRWIHEAINFNPRSPCGERRGYRSKELASKRISIHAPRAGSDKAAGKTADAG